MSKCPKVKLSIHNLLLPLHKISNDELIRLAPDNEKETDLRGWDEVDVVFITGDAYVDHPAFGAAVIGRVLEHAGYRVALITQPNWRDDLRDFRKFGKPRLFFGVSAGCMDSMVNHYTANKRLRSNDAYTPGGEAGFRPDYATITYCNILKNSIPMCPSSSAASKPRCAA